jgi:hypothetical protein
MAFVRERVSFHHALHDDGLKGLEVSFDSIPLGRQTGVHEVHSDFPNRGSIGGAGLLLRMGRRLDDAGKEKSSRAVRGSP